MTAQKRGNSVQRVPATDITATGAQLVQRGVVQVDEIGKIAPGLQVTQSRSQAQFYLRGFGQPNNSPNADPYIALNLNDAFIPSQMSNAAFYDVQRVEVLYGPQGTLYGRNSLGGVVNVTTNRPAFDFGGSAEIEYGNYNTLNGTAVLNLPISRTLALRIAGNRVSHDGYESDGAYDAGRDNVRASLLFEPDANTSLYAVGSYGRIKEVGASLLNIPALSCGNFCNPENIYADGLHVRSNIYTGSLELSHRFSDVLSLTDISSYSKVDQDTTIGAFYNVAGNSVYQAGAPNVENYSNELKATINASRLKGIVGFYAYHQSGNLFSRTIFGKTGPTGQVGPYYDTETGQAGYIDLTYSLLDKLRVAGGFRYSHDSRKLNGTNSAFPGGVQTVTQTYSNSGGKDRPDFKAGVEFDVAPRSLLYANFETGYNGQGFSSSPTSATDHDAKPYASTTGYSFQAGAKNRLFDNHLQFNIEGFYNRYKNYQISFKDTFTAQQTIYNAPLAKTYGVQVDARYRLAQSDELGLGFTLLSAKQYGFTLPSPPFTNLNGYELPYAPHFTLNADYRHTFFLRSGATVAFLGNVRYSSSEWLIYYHPAGSFQDANVIADASLTYRPDGGKWSLGGFVKNLNNAYVFALASSGIPGPGIGVPLAPRTYGVRVTADF